MIEPSPCGKRQPKGRWGAPALAGEFSLWISFRPGVGLSWLREWARRRRPEARAVTIVRQLAESGTAAEAIRASAGGPLAVQRALRGAFAAGALPPTALREAQLPAPRADEDHLLDALARVRAGEPLEAARTRLATRDGRTLTTAFGSRNPARALTIAPLLARFDLLVPDRAQPREPLRAALRRDAERDPAACLRLAALRHPDDASWLVAARDNAGRRGDHTLLEAMGIHGDPSLLAPLRGALHARDIDPGRGFVQRRLAADGLGRLGLAAGIPLLLRALGDERADFEGRPGAGLGIQYPVRANLLWALGELGAESAIPTLIAYLGETSGSAFGGFYLPAMDALVRIGTPARAALERAARDGNPQVAANAAGALVALSEGA